jgi:predicted nucleic acid-binding Zn ribbon protein
MDKTALYNKKAASERIAKVGPLMEKILAGFGLLHDLSGWRVVTGWPQIVGNKIAEVSKAVRFSDDTLLVSVPDDGWRQQLSLEVDEILNKIHSLPGGKVVRRIHFIS